jgi:hypothetical protein
MTQPPSSPGDPTAPRGESRSWLRPWIEPGAQPPPPRPAGPPARRPAGGRAADTTNEADASLVRPFIVTGGRTRPLHSGLRLETMLVAAPGAESAKLQFEQRRIIDMTRRAVSLAEVAAGLAMPVGVVRVLVSDLYYANLIKLVEPHVLSVDVIERIRDLVRAL